MFGITGMSSVLKIVPSLPRPVVHFNSLVYSVYRFRVQMTRMTGGTGYYNLYRYSSTGDKKKNSLTKMKDRSVNTGSLEQMKENTKTASYLGVIVIGVGVTGFLFYTIFRELFSSKSPYSVYSSALKKCAQESRVQNALGEPIKGFGEESKRGRRRHISHLFYERDGVNYLRMKFYIQGSRRQGTVYLEMREDDKYKFQYRYLLVQMDDYPPETIIIEDNRYDKTPLVSDKPFDIS